MNKNIFLNIKISILIFIKKPLLYFSINFNIKNVFVTKQILLHQIVNF